jgi:hypothetical protein
MTTPEKENNFLFGFTQIKTHTLWLLKLSKGFLKSKKQLFMSRVKIIIKKIILFEKFLSNQKKKKKI